MSSDIVSILKTQMMLNMTRRGVNKNSVRSICALQLFDFLISKAPDIGRAMIDRWTKVNKISKLEEGLKDTKDITASIMVEKYFSGKSSGSSGTASTNNTMTHNNNTVVESIVYQIASLERVKSLRYIGKRLLPNFMDEIIVDRESDIYFKLIEIDLSDTGDLEKITFKLFSYKNSITHIKRFMRSCEKEYIINIHNKLGDNI